MTLREPSSELGDHFDFAENPFANRTEDIIFITGKDAVKCRHDPALAGDQAHLGRRS